MSWSPSLPPIDAIELADFLAREPRVCLYFWARWNGVERKFDPVLSSVVGEFPEIAFRSVDVDDPALAAFCLKCNVNNVSALGCFSTGRHRTTIVGARAASELRETFQKLLNDIL
jgi:thiol-disulfide isomerase/thioredoxin